MVETQGTSGMAKTAESNRKPRNSMNVKKQKRPVTAWTQTTGPEAMLTSAGPSNSRNANSSLYAFLNCLFQTCMLKRAGTPDIEGTPTREDMPTMVLTPEKEGMSTTGGPQPQHNCIQQLEC